MLLSVLFVFHWQGVFSTPKKVVAYAGLIFNNLINDKVYEKQTFPKITLGRDGLKNDTL